MTIEYAFIVKNKTRLETLIERFGTKPEAKLYIENQGGDFKDYQTEHDDFHTALDLLQSKLSGVLVNRILDRSEVENYFPENSVVIVFGDDALVAYTSKYTKRIPIVAVNPDKDRYDGLLLPFDIDNFLDGVRYVMINNYKAVVVNFAEANLNNGQRLLAFHDFFIGARSHQSAKYKISFKDRSENQLSSGIIVSTKAGSTRWLSSMFNMAYGITNAFNDKTKFSQPRMNSKHLIFAVREPFKSKKTAIEVSAGLMYREDKLIIESHMPMDGVIFSDGIEDDFIDFNSGSIVSIGLSNTYSNLVRNIELPPGYMAERRAFRRD